MLHVQSIDYRNTWYHNRLYNSLGYTKYILTSLGYVIAKDTQNYIRIWGYVADGIRDLVTLAHYLLLHPHAIIYSQQDVDEEW
jgi:hypothetical protein